MIAGRQALAQDLRPDSSPSPLFQSVRAMQCLVIDRQSGFETIVNLCQECRTANVQHKRPGQVAIHRQMPVPGGAKVQLPFRGPGKTRISSETYCGNKNPALQLETDRKCVSIKPLKNAGMTLVNVCEKCRQVVIERVGGSGRASRSVNAVNGRSYVPLPRDGANSARILDERACR